MTKQCKSLKKTQISQQNSLKCNKIPLIVHILKEISDFSTSVIRRNLKLIHMGMNFRLLHNVESTSVYSTLWSKDKLPHIADVEQFVIAPRGKIAPHDKTLCQVVQNCMLLLSIVVYCCPLLPIYLNCVCFFYRFYYH